MKLIFTGQVVEIVLVLHFEMAQYQLFCNKIKTCQFG